MQPPSTRPRQLTCSNRSINVGQEPTLRIIWKSLACQHDLRGRIVPFLTKAKILIQDIWKEPTGWDDPIQPQSLRSGDSWPYPNGNSQMLRTSFCRLIDIEQRSSHLLRCWRESVQFCCAPTSKIWPEGSPCFLCPARHLRRHCPCGCDRLEVCG